MNLAPLIGSFSLGTIHELVERLGRVSHDFLEGVNFRGYLTTQSQGNIYGLELLSVETALEPHLTDIKSLTLSATNPSGRSMSVTIRFGQTGQISRGQYVIAASDKFDQEDMRSMLMGQYVPLTQEELHLREVMRQSENTTEDDQIVRPRPPKAVKLESTRRPSESGEEEDIVKDAFSFPRNLPVERIDALLDRLQEEYLKGASLNLRIVLRGGEAQTSLSQAQLRDTLGYQRDEVLRLLVEMATPEGEWLELKLSFAPNPTGPNAEVYLISPRARQLMGALRKFLQMGKEETPHTQVQAFTFDPATFQLDKVLQLMAAASLRYLSRSPLKGHLTTTSGDSYPDLRPEPLREKYLAMERKIEKLTLQSGEPNRGYVLLEFFIRGNKAGQGRIEGHGLPEEAANVLWQALGRCFKVTVAEATNNAAMRVTPNFKARDFEEQTRHQLVIMPLEAYWSEAVFEQIQVTMTRLGYKVEKAPGIFEAGASENIWTAINEAGSIIADLTYKHPDVLYLLGIADTLGKEVVIISQHERDLPADWRKRPWIKYDSHESGLETLGRLLTSITEEYKGS